MKVWGQPSKGRSNSGSVISVREAPTEHNSEVTSELDSLFAEEVARRTMELLDSQGWCLWKCSTLGGDIIAVVLDKNVEGVPGGYPVYTAAELEELCRDSLHMCSEKVKGVGEVHLRLIHEAKKLAGGIVVSGEKVEKNLDHPDHLDPKPIKGCPACGGSEFWPDFKDKRFVCCRCHPKPAAAR